ncbi:hypothetical protein KBC70_04155 [Candidatus Woesebacteria bacterium]|nr:hypothetical protein [Candidatus Woesebacteria bacterium]
MYAFVFLSVLLQEVTDEVTQQPGSGLASALGEFLQNAMPFAIIGLALLAMFWWGIPFINARMDRGGSRKCSVKNCGNPAKPFGTGGEYLCETHRRERVWAMGSVKKDDGHEDFR